VPFFSGTFEVGAGVSTVWRVYGHGFRVGDSFWEEIQRILWLHFSEQWKLVYDFGTRTGGLARVSVQSCRLREMGLSRQLLRPRASRF
jgi:hypothetical protein